MTKTDTSTEAIAKLLDGVTKGSWAYNSHREVGPLHTDEDQAFGMICEPVCEVNFDAEHIGNARFIAAARELVPALAAERDALRAERERLALAICGGEDAPGYANAQTVDALESIAMQNRNMHASTVNSLLRAETERDALRAEIERLRATQPDVTAMVEALEKCTDKLEQTLRNEFEGVWDEADFRNMLAPYRAAITAWEAANG